MSSGLCTLHRAAARPGAPKRNLDLQPNPELFLSKLLPELPLISSWQLKEGGNGFGVTILTITDYTHGIGRHLSDALSRKFLPGKFLEIVGAKSLSFRFYPNTGKGFALLERWIAVSHPEEIAHVQKRLPRFIEELRLTLLSIIKARQFLSLHSHALSDLPILTEIQHLSIFEEMQQVIQRLTAEKTLERFRSSIVSFHEKRPKFSTRDF